MNVFYVTALKQFVLGVRTDVAYTDIVAANSSPRLAPGNGAVALPRLTDAEIRVAMRLEDFPTLYTFYLD